MVSQLWNKLRLCLQKTKQNKILIIITWTWEDSTHSKRSNLLRLYPLQKFRKLKTNFLFLVCLFIYFCVSEYFAHRYISALHECSAHRGPKRALASLELDLQVVMKHCGGVLVPERLREQPMLSATEPSLWPHEAATKLSHWLSGKGSPQSSESAFSI